MYYLILYQKGPRWILYTNLNKTRHDQMAPTDNYVIISIVEGLKGHKHLIQAVRNENIDDLLKNYVGYQYLYDAVEYQE